PSPSRTRRTDAARLDRNRSRLLSNKGTDLLDGALGRHARRVLGHADHSGGLGVAEAGSDAKADQHAIACAEACHRGEDTAKLIAGVDLVLDARRGVRREPRETSAPEATAPAFIDDGVSRDAEQ